MVFREVVLLFTIYALSAEALSWKNCDSNAAVKVKALSVRPTPIQLKEGSKLTLSGSADINGDAGVNYRMELSIKRKIGSWVPIWVKVPCLSNVGSCTYTGLNCLKIWKELGKPATCPVPAGTHSLPTTTITIPKVDIPSFLTSGQYWAQGKLIDTDKNRVVACVEIDARIS